MTDLKKRLNRLSAGTDNSIAGGSRAETVEPDEDVTFSDEPNVRMGTRMRERGRALVGGLPSRAKRARLHMP
ncbi:MAG: hypothetical protein ACI87E_001535 [Mariniblastus sp.]|jgi:hypothetical protein